VGLNGSKMYVSKDRCKQADRPCVRKYVQKASNGKAASKQEFRNGRNINQVPGQKNGG